LRTGGAPDAGRRRWQAALASSRLAGARLNEVVIEVMNASENEELKARRLLNEAVLEVVNIVMQGARIDAPK